MQKENETNPPQEDEKQTQQKQNNDKKNQRKDNNRNNNNRREGGGNRQRYVKKGEEDNDNDEQGERQRKGREYEHRKRNNNDEERKGGGFRRKQESKYDWDKAKITKETEVPKVPGAKERIDEPDRKQLDKKLKDIDEQISKIFKNKSNKIRDLYDGLRDQKEKNKDIANPKRDTLKEKQAAKDEHFKVFKEAKEVVDAKNKEIENLHDQATKMRQKIKKLNNVDNIEEKLEELNYRYNNEKLSLQEEKRIIKEIEDLEACKPFVAPLLVIEDKMKTLRKEKNELVPAKNKAWNNMKAIEDEIKNIKDSLDEIKKYKEENKTDIEPIIEKYNKDAQDKADALRANKKKLLDDYYKTLNDYRDQQELIDYSKYVKRIKDNILREEKRQKYIQEKEARQEEEKKADDAEKGEKFLHQVHKCRTLIVYLENLKPKQAGKETTQEEQKNVNVEEVLKEGQWKKEQVEIVIGKRANDEYDDGKFFSQGNKKGGKKGRKQQNQQKQEQTEEKPAKQNLDHPYDIRIDFDEVRIQPPTELSQIDATIESIQKRIDYYENDAAKEEAEKKKEEQDNLTEQDKSDRVIKDKKEKKQKRQQEFKLDNNEDFPTM